IWCCWSLFCTADAPIQRNSRQEGAARPGSHDPEARNSRPAGVGTAPAITLSTIYKKRPPQRRDGTFPIERDLDKGVLLATAGRLFCLLDVYAGVSWHEDIQAGGDRKRHGRSANPRRAAQARTGALPDHGVRRRTPPQL